MDKLQEAHGCTKCYEVNLGFHEVKNGIKICDECGGVVLNLQEAFDKLAQQQSELTALGILDE